MVLSLTQRTDQVECWLIKAFILQLIDVNCFVYSPASSHFYLHTSWKRLLLHIRDDKLPGKEIVAAQSAPTSTNKSWRTLIKFVQLLGRKRHGGQGRQVNGTPVSGGGFSWGNRVFWHLNKMIACRRKGEYYHMSCVLFKLEPPEMASKPREWAHLQLYLKMPPNTEWGWNLPPIIIQFSAHWDEKCVKWLLQKFLN